MWLSSTSCTAHSVTVGNVSPSWPLDMPYWLRYKMWLFWPLLWELWLPPIQFLTTSCPTKMPWSFGLHWHSATLCCCSTFKVIVMPLTFFPFKIYFDWNLEFIGGHWKINKRNKDALKNTQISQAVKYPFRFVCFDSQRSKINKQVWRPFYIMWH